MELQATLFGERSRPLSLVLSPRKSAGRGKQIGRASYQGRLPAMRTRHLKEFYQRLRAAGKPAKVALTAVMHKLIVLMNQILKNPNFVLQN
jgi:transposase